MFRGTVGESGTQPLTPLSSAVVDEEDSESRSSSGDTSVLQQPLETETRPADQAAPRTEQTRVDDAPASASESAVSTSSPDTAAEKSESEGESIAPDSEPSSPVASSAEGEASPALQAQPEVSSSSPPPAPVVPEEKAAAEDTRARVQQPLVSVVESQPSVVGEEGHREKPEAGSEDSEDSAPPPVSPDPRGTVSPPSDPEVISPPPPVLDSVQSSVQPSVEASVQPSVQSPPRAPHPQDTTPHPKPDAVPALPVNVPQSGSQVDANTPTPAPKAPTKTSRPRSGRKESADVIVDIDKPSPYSSAGLNGSAQLAADASADCSQLLDPGTEDSTPLLRQTSRDTDTQSPPASPSHPGNSITNTNTTTRTSRGLRSRLQRPVKIPTIPEDCLASKRMATSLEDITSLRLWKGIIAEFVGVLLLVLVGCGSCLSLDDSSSPSVVQIALCFGLSVATIVWSIGHVSGGHINPAVTLALLATRKISLAKAVFFVLFQLLGAVVGAGILMGLTPKKYQGTLGSTLVNDNLDPGKGLGVEIFITFVLVFTVFASIDAKRRDLNGSTPLTVGLSVTMCHLFAIQYTGASMNTARSFGPALVTGKWDNHWVYWVGPITGGVVAGLLYEYLFAVNASLTKVRACVLSSDYDDDKFRAKKIKVRIVEEDPEATTETLALTPSDGQTAIEDP